VKGKRSVYAQLVIENSEEGPGTTGGGTPSKRIAGKRLGVVILKVAKRRTRRVRADQ